MKIDLQTLLEDGTIPRLLITLGITGVLVYMFAQQLPVPEQLFDAGLVIIGFYFGSTTKNGKSSGPGPTSPPS